MTDAATAAAPPADLSAALLSAVRRGEPTERIEAAIESLPPRRLEDSVDAARRAFWINLYEAEPHHARRRNLDVRRRICTMTSSFVGNWPSPVYTRQ